MRVKAPADIKGFQWLISEIVWRTVMVIVRSGLPEPFIASSMMPQTLRNFSLIYS
jgi:hypothetical protein